MGMLPYKGLHTCTTVHNNNYCIMALQFLVSEGLSWKSASEARKTHCENKNLPTYSTAWLALYSYIQMAGKHANDIALCPTDVQRIFAQSE